MREFVSHFSVGMRSRASASDHHMAYWSGGNDVMKPMDPDAQERIPTAPLDKNIC